MENDEKRMDEPDEVDKLLAENPEYFTRLFGDNDDKKVVMACLMIKYGLTVEELSPKNDDGKMILKTP